MCRPKSGHKGKRGCLASSVMLLDCAKLTHWRYARAVRRNVRLQARLHGLGLPEAGGPQHHRPVRERWNDFDHLDQETRLLHNTKRKTQPWKTGLPVDFRPQTPSGCSRPATGSAAPAARCSATTASRAATSSTPIRTRNASSSACCRECVDQGLLTEAGLKDEMARNHIRHDALELLDRVPRLAA